MAKAKSKPKKKSFGAGMGSVLASISSDTFHAGFGEHEDIWADTGNYALNRMMSGRFDVGLLYGRQYVYFGESGSGKTVACAYLCGFEQVKNDAFVAWIDAERSNTGQAGKKYLTKLGIDTSPDKFFYATAATLEDINKQVAKMVSYYRAALKEGTLDKLQPMIIVIDSWGAVLTNTQMKNATEGEMKGDQGQLAKQTGDLIKKINHLVGNLPILTIGINHIYDNQEKNRVTGRVIGRKHKTTGGNKMIFMASGVLMLTKKELKGEDVESEVAKKAIKDFESKTLAELKKDRKTVGIICQAENLKSRVAKPFETVDVQIPWVGGMDPYSGLYDLLMAEGTVYVPATGWRAYLKDGKEVKFREKEFRKKADAIMAAAPADITDLTEEELEKVYEEEASTEETVSD